MALLRSETRIYGNATVDTFLKIDGDNTTFPATSNSTGALRVAGGIGVKGNVFSSGNIISLNANLGNLVTANYFSGTLTTANQYNITNVGTLTNLTVNGNTTLTGNLIVTGTTVTVNSNNVSYEDSLIELHTTADLLPLSGDDGKDIGVHVHYYKTTDKHAFFGFSNDTQAFEYYVDGTETNGVFSGVYGNIKGQTFISNTATGIAPLVVASTTKVTNLNADLLDGYDTSTANTASTVVVRDTGGNISANYIAGTLTTANQYNITNLGIMTGITLIGPAILGNVANVTIYGGTDGYYLQTDGQGKVVWAPITAGTGNANISGSDTQLFFNDSGSNTLGSSANLTFNKTTKTLTVTNVIGELTGNVTGNVTGNLTGNVTGNLIGNTYGNVYGNLIGNSYGNLTGNVTGNVYGNLIGNSYGNLTGNVIGNVYGNLVGNSYGNLTGNVIGDVYGNLIGNVSGNISVTGGIGEIEFIGSAGNLISSPNLTFTASTNTLTANYFNGTLTTAYQPNVNSLGTLANLNVSGNTNLTGANVSLGNVSNLHITGGTDGYVLKTDGSGNLSWISAGAALAASGGINIISNISNVVAGSSLDFTVSYTDPAYPGGTFYLDSAGPVSFTATDIWQGGTTSKNAYANYIAGTVNTTNVSITLTLANATFSVKSTDTLIIGASTVTGTNLTALNITANGTYIIPSSYLAAGVQTTATNSVSANLTTSRGVKTATGSTLTNNQPVPFNVTALSGTFASSSVPYWSLTQTFSWNATATSGATVASGNVTYSGATSGSLTAVGAISGTSPSLDSSSAYTITSSDYTGAGQYGAGTRVMTATVNGTVAAATKYYPLFYKITTSSSLPTFTVSDSRGTRTYALGDGAATNSTSSNYLWIAIPNYPSNSSGLATHAFKHVFGGFDIVDTPVVTGTQTITSAGQSYNYSIYGFTGFSAATTIITTS